MSQDEKDIALALRQVLAEQIGQERYDVWFSAGVEISADGSNLRVTAGHLFHLERLRKSFRIELETIARQVLGTEATVSFCVDAVTDRATTTPVPRVVREEPKVELPRVTPSAETTRRALARLDGFVVGDANRLAHAAAQSVSKRLGQASPLLIYGPTGTGKTHLLEGIATSVRQLSRQSRAVMLSAEQFTTYFLEALQGSGLPMFRRKYRDVDLLLIDDVQFFAGKKATLVEVQHTLDTLARAGKQLVLSADRPPAELQNLGSELIARMAGGLVVGMESPGEEVRYGVLQQFATQMPVAFPDEVLRWMAGQFSGDARQLRGALHRISAASEAFCKPVSLELAVQSTRDLLSASRRAVQLVDIERAICNIFEITPAALHAEKRTKNICLPRALAMWLARRYTRSGVVEIGEFFGRRSHSTVIAAHNNVERWRSDGQTVVLGGGTYEMVDAIKRVEAELRLA